MATPTPLPPLQLSDQTRQDARAYSGLGDYGLGGINISGAATGGASSGGASGSGVTSTDWTKLALIGGAILLAWKLL